jgi:hypothetical protein
METNTFPGNFSGTGKLCLSQFFVTVKSNFFLISESLTAFSDSENKNNYF